MLVRPCVQNAPRKLAIQVLAKSMGKRPRGLPGPRWGDYTSDLAWSRLSVEPAELSEIAFDHEIFQVLLGLLPPLPCQEEKRHENE